MCRREIPQSFLEHPTLLKPESLASNTTKHDDHKKEDSEDECDDDDESTQEFRWFYQGRNGWWEYDERTASELEHHHKKGDKNCELLIAGFLYSIDFENMLQSRRNEPQRRRQIKRDLISNVSDKKGVAGIRTTATGATSSSSTTTSNANSATTSGMDDLANQMSNVSLNNPQPVSTRPTLRNLVDLGASGASISLSQEADDEDDDANVV